MFGDEVRQRALERLDGAAVVADLPLHLRQEQQFGEVGRTLALALEHHLDQPPLHHAGLFEAPEDAVALDQILTTGIDELVPFGVGLDRARQQLLDQRRAVVSLCRFLRQTTLLSIARISASKMFPLESSSV